MKKLKVSQWGFPWDRPINWNKLEYSVSKFGRKFIRHPSGMGTVMSVNDGKERNILVLDRKYMGFETFFDIDRSLPFTKCSEEGTPEYSTDEIMNKNPICIQDPNCSRINTSWMIDNKHSGIALHCRNIKIKFDGIEVDCDVPNINILSRIFAEKEKLVEMDSSYEIALDETNPTYEEKIKHNDLSDWFDNDVCWSSSWYGTNENGFNFGLILSCSGLIEGLAQDVSCAVIPILEI